MDLAEIATVEVTSEDPQFPIEASLASQSPGWRAAGPGDQQVRLIFDAPISINRVHLRFEESAAERTQEFTLRWSAVHGGPSIEIVRQQWNFSPSGSTSEVEDYTVGLNHVSVLELAIRPDISGNEAIASLAEFRIR